MELLEINLRKILRERIGGWKGRLIPGFMIGWLERLIRQEELNEILRITYPAEGTAFAEAMYAHLELDIQVEGEENIPGEGRFLFACNHPLGGLDGVGLVKVLGAKYGDDGIRFVVNDMLMHVEPLRPVFLAVNKYGKQSRESALALREAFSSADKQMVVFPAGLVSRLGKDGRIADLEWQKSFVQMAVRSRRDVIPMRFDGLNRLRFYRTARWRKRLGLKVNIEQALLPGELCAARGNAYRVTFGKPISWQDIKGRLEAGESQADVAASIREEVYRL